MSTTLFRIYFPIGQMSYDILQWKYNWHWMLDSMKKLIGYII